MNITITTEGDGYTPGTPTSQPTPNPAPYCPPTLGELVQYQTGQIVCQGPGTPDLATTGGSVEPFISLAVPAALIAAGIVGVIVRARSRRVPR